MNPPPNEPRPLRLTPTPPAPGERAVALFLSGGEPSAWLDEICALAPGGVQTGIKIYVLLRSGADRRPAGALAVWPGGEPVLVSARAQAYRVLVGRFYLPADARLEPPVADDELTRLCPSGEVFVFHPGAGLCAFRSDDALSLADLISAPAVSTEDWAGACPGLTPNARLRSVRLEMSADLDALFGGAAQEIGVDPPDADEMPPAPGEAATGSGASAGRKLREWLASAALGFTGMLPRSASSPTWANRLENWANGVRSRVSADLGETRHRELHRLLNLLEKDPAEGLRRALPLSGLFRRRGVAPPGGQLGRRDPNFRLGALAGGGAADAWDVPPDLQTRLRERYRQLANEETRLGRHRRAAYIYAELLGDLSSAALCLKQGEHYHEAAVLYRDHLHRPLEAADCLAAGGEYAEAAAIYEKEKRYLQAAAMHQAMGDEGAAAVAYRREVERLVETGDRLAAAELLETNLAAPDEAILVLRQGWPGSPQAGRCLEKLFERLGARGLHPQATSLIAELAVKTPAPLHALPLVRELATAQATYPDETVRHAARDLARVTVAGRLPAAGPPEVRHLVEILNRLAPQDRLLVRDGHRYLADRLEQEKRRPPAAPPRAKTPPPPVSSRRTVRRAGSFQMPATARWQQFRSMGSYFLAAGFAPGRKRVEVARVAWDGFSQSVVWLDLATAGVGNGSDPLLLEGARGQGGFVVCASALSTIPPLNPRRFPVADRLGWERPVECGQPSWWPAAVLAASFSADGNLWLLRAAGQEGEMLLACHAPHGGLVSQMTFPLPVTQVVFGWDTPGFHLISLGNSLLVACADRLMIRQGESDWQELAFDARITGLVPTPSLARAGCAVRLENGVALVWLDRPTEVQTVVTGLVRPLAAFTRQGTLVVVPGEERGGRLYEIVGGQAREAAAFDGVGDRPVAVLGTVDREAFAIVDEEGPVHLYTG